MDEVQCVGPLVYVLVFASLVVHRCQVPFYCVVSLFLKVFIDLTG